MPHCLKYIDFCSKHRQGGSSFWNQDLSAFTNGASAVPLCALCFVLEAELSVSLWKTHFHPDVLVFSTKMSSKVKATHGALWRQIHVQPLLRWRALQLPKTDTLVTVLALPARGTNTHFPLWTLSSQIICFRSHRVVVTLLFTSIDNAAVLP